MVGEEQSARVVPGGMTGWASAVVVGSLTAIVLTAERLPLRVASHFGPDGRANGYMDRPVYLAVMIGLLIVMPTFAALVIGQSARTSAARLRVPNADYWLDPARRDDSARFLGVHFGWFAASVSLLGVATHLLVIEANELNPPTLAARPFLGVLVGFTVLMVVWIGAFQRRFRRP